jgi:hypothetical protein
MTSCRRIEGNGVDGPDRRGVDGHQLDAKRQRFRMVLDDGGRRRQATTLRHTGEIQQRESTVPHLPQPPVLMMLWIRTPKPVEEIAVLIHLVVIGTFRSGRPIGGPYRDGEIEDGRLEDALLTDQRHPLTFEPEARQIGPRHRPLPVIIQLVDVAEGNRPDQILSLHRLSDATPTRPTNVG